MKGYIEMEKKYIVMQPYIAAVHTYNKYTQCISMSTCTYTYTHRLCVTVNVLDLYVSRILDMHVCMHRSSSAEVARITDSMNESMRCPFGVPSP